MSGNFLATFKSFFNKFTDKPSASSSLPAANNNNTKNKGSSYIVTFKRDTPDEVIDAEVQKAKDSGAKVTNVYKAALRGYAVTVPDDLVSSFSLKHENVEHIEADGVVTTQGKELLA